MAATESFGEKLRETIKQKDLSIREFAIRAKVNRAHLHEVLDGKSSPSIEFAERVAKALGMQLTDLLESN